MVGFARAGLGQEVVWAKVRELSGVARVLVKGTARYQLFSLLPHFVEADESLSSM